MCRIADEVYSTDRINVVCEQLARFILNEIMDPRDECYHDGHIHRGLPQCPKGPSSWTINMTCTIINIFKRDALLFVYL